MQIARTPHVLCCPSSRFVHRSACDDAHPVTTLLPAPLGSAMLTLAAASQPRPCSRPRPHAHPHLHPQPHRFVFDVAHPRLRSFSKVQRRHVRHEPQQRQLKSSLTSSGDVGGGHGCERIWTRSASRATKVCPASWRSRFSRPNSCSTGTAKVGAAAVVRYATATAGRAGFPPATCLCAWHCAARGPCFRSSRSSSSSNSSRQYVGHSRRLLQLYDAGKLRRVHVYETGGGDTDTDFAFSTAASANTLDTAAILANLDDSGISSNPASATDAAAVGATGLTGIGTAGVAAAEAAEAAAAAAEAAVGTRGEAFQQLFAGAAAAGVATAAVAAASLGGNPTQQDAEAAAVGGENRNGNGSAVGVSMAGSVMSRLSTGGLLSLCQFAALLSALLLVDSIIWKLIRRPLAAFLLTIPFTISAALTAYTGTLVVPLLARLRAGQVVREEGPKSHAAKAGTPTMGGLFFVPIGVLVAWVVAGGPREMVGPAVATMAFMALGAVDDGLSLTKKHNYGLPGKVKFLLQVAGGVAFFFWLNSANLKSPYTWKLLVPLPLPLGLWYLGRLYLPLTALCFAATSNAVNLTDGLDGLAAGTCAAALVGMAVAVLPVYPALSIFGASMAGACIGFLAHNLHRARVFMGDAGSLALGAALAAMAATTGLFLPLVVAGAVFIAETLSVIIQVSCFQATKLISGMGQRFFLMAPLHHHLELRGWPETSVVAVAYAASLASAALAAYVALISV